MNNKLKMIDTTSKILHKMTYKIDSILDKQKQKLADKYFMENKQVQEYIKNFDNNYDTSYIDDSGCLCRGNEFDLNLIPDTLQEQFKEYMESYHGLYYKNTSWFEGFTIDTFDNIYIDDRENIIYNSYTCNHKDFTNDLDLFIQLELMQAETGCYPDIIFTDYYGGYYSDYTTPEQYKFLKTCMHKKEDRLLYFLSCLHDLTQKDTFYDYNSNFIINEFTPDFIKKIYLNLDVNLSECELDNDFNLELVYEIPTKLKTEHLNKLVNYYGYNTYGETVITIKVNIKDWLQTELNKGYSFDDLKENKNAA